MDANDLQGWEAVHLGHNINWTGAWRNIHVKNMNSKLPANQKPY